MKKFMAFAVATLMFLPAFAAWDMLDEQPAAKVYVDRTTIKRVGNHVTMASLIDLAFTDKQLKESPPMFRSTRQQDEYDCIGRRMRLQSYTLFAGPMGTGKAVMQYDEGTAWSSIDANSRNALKWKAACAA
jgi:hypothetical protein